MADQSRAAGRWRAGNRRTAGAGGARAELRQRVGAQRRGRELCAPGDPCREGSFLRRDKHALFPGPPAERRALGHRRSAAGTARAGALRGAPGSAPSALKRTRTERLSTGNRTAPGCGPGFTGGERVAHPTGMETGTRPGPSRGPPASAARGPPASLGPAPWQRGGTTERRA